nr:uncharacterized protein LOC109160848 [Ipomoea batatas]
MFEQAWIKDPECKELIFKSWSDSRGLSVPCKLSNCAAELKKWGGDLGKKISRNIDRIKAQIAQASTVRDDEHNELISMLDTRLNELLHQHEIFWSQRAKQFWLAKGDLNTQYFHNYASKRHKKNRISKLKNNEVLLQRRVEIPPDCPLCHKEVESRSHLFLDCEFSKPVWDNTILPLHILEASFESWLSQVVDLDDENKSRSIIAILWTVWKNRNEYVWNNKQWNVNAIRISVTNCIKDWQCWCDLQKANTSSIPLQTVQRTQGIDASWVYCEVDASVIENSASFGAVIHTHSGLFLAAISGPLRPVNEARLAEALAIKEALSWLKSKQWQKICILTDGSFLAKE